MPPATSRPEFARTLDGGGVRIDEIVMWRRPTGDLPGHLKDGHKAIPVVVKGCRTTVHVGPFPSMAAAEAWLERNCPAEASVKAVA